MFNIMSASLQLNKEEDALILGHLSMLLDIVISHCGKYVITCDRDEKIRVSHFPHAYNIQTFCLGHTDFVTCLQILPHDPTILLSSSGDGTIRAWRFLGGLEVKAFS